MEQTIVIFLALFAGVALGAFAAWFYAKSKLERTEGVPVEEVNRNYVARSLFEDGQRELKEKQGEVVQLSSQLAGVKQQSADLETRLAEHKAELTELQDKMKLQFEHISNKIFEEKSNKFLELNEKKVFDILNPLKERIVEFEKKVNDSYNKEAQERASLKTELKSIVEMNKQMSEDARNLTQALKGDKKLQGDWGEVQLELILDKAGLEKDVHYRKQANFKDEEGRNQRPDYVINLPEEKHLVVDAKVSLVAYEQYFNSDEDSTVRETALKAHLLALKNHIQELGGKNYQKLYDINPPDYVLLFVPIEPALYLALREDTQLFEKALERNIVLVSTSTLLATLRTISYIWKQDNQRKNVAEIASESGKLYDKFHGFIEDLIGLGKRLDTAKSDYENAMNKLFDSKQYGGTIMGRMERIKKLGADATKQLPQSLLDRIEEGEAQAE